MKRIYRYPLEITDRVTLRLPIGARILSVGPPRGGSGFHLDLWALVDPDADGEDRFFCIVGTGNPAPDFIDRHIGTVATAGGALIWHVFEEAR